MAVPKKKRYKQIVRSRRSLQKVELVKRQNLGVSYFSNFDNRATWSDISVPEVEQRKFHPEKGYFKRIRIVNPDTFECTTVCCMCNVTKTREIGLYCATSVYPFMAEQWKNEEPPWKLSYFYPKAILNIWYKINFWQYTRVRKIYRNAYRPEWSMKKYQYTPWEKRMWKLYYKFEFQEAVFWGMLERDRVWRDTFWRRSRDLYGNWDLFKRRLGHLKIDLIHDVRRVFYFWIIIIDDHILPHDLEERVTKFLNFFKKYI